MAEQVVSGGDAAEWRQVAELRAVTQAQDPSCKVRPRPRPRPLRLFHDSIPSVSVHYSSRQFVSHHIYTHMATIYIAYLFMPWPCLNLNVIHNEHNIYVLLIINQQPVILYIYTLSCIQDHIQYYHQTLSYVDNLPALVGYCNDKDEYSYCY